MASAPGNTGARLWDMATQGSDYTAPPGQHPMIPGGPEGVVYARPGTVCSDELGNLWRKETDVSLNTGWCEMLDTCNILELVGEFQGGD